MAKILIIEDNEDLVEFVCVFLKLYKHEVIGIRTGNDLNKALETFVPDLLLIDIMLPDEDGREVCKAFKESHKNTPVILFSANTNALLGYEKWGADDIIEKPFNIKDVLDKINKQLK